MVILKQIIVLIFHIIEFYLFYKNCLKTMNTHIYNYKYKYQKIYQY